MDYETLLNIKYKSTILNIIISLLFLLSIYIILNQEFYDNYKTYGVVNDSIIYVNVPINYSDTLKTGEYLKISNKKYDYQILEVGALEVDEENHINYQTFAMKIDEELLENEVLTITFYFNKEKNYQKLKRLI